MKKLNDEELMRVLGGGINLGVVALISGALTFIIGIFDGIVRPLKCN